MYRFFVEPENISGLQVYINAEQTHHIEKVLRLKIGNIIRVFDGQNHEYEIRLIGKENESLKGEIIQEIKRHAEAPLFLSLVQGISKGDKMENIIQKAVEIGVGEIYPLISQYTVVKMEQERIGKKKQRWQSIAREACKQCCRNRIPAIHNPITFSQMLDLTQGYPAILLYEGEDQRGLKSVLREKAPTFLSASRTFLIIGPEGGFSPEEAAQAKANNIITAGLGPRILRTETAGIVAASIVLYELADLG
ncbi:Ribosomal RNA small subunit methyltransferase E [Syntrophomonas zehnderi OL-4]|uniref:Ribosomal RNA small subunit methyltransferase E n=1 Tax=Syntrophomonas zehnderi OL-4 TaxID=690567 RepID=A0A0E4C9G1_9FIRM|nr:16S rRNA (uracil(1498)-N(3))-methyltransferase [Syntrophomonas zehnderi]CFX99119.1 Ribosomal RNA small subunit methyltransferase E [Syntrophomonas zehnderi OL-4]